MTKQLNERFKRPVYRNDIIKLETKQADRDYLTRFYPDTSFQGVKRLYVFAFNNVDNNAKKLKEIVIELYYLQCIN